MADDRRLVVTTCDGEYELDPQVVHEIMVDIHLKTQFMAQDTPISVAISGGVIRWMDHGGNMEQPVVMDGPRQGTPEYEKITALLALLDTALFIANIKIYHLSREMWDDMRGT